MPPQAVGNGGVRFGVFELDVCARELRKQGRRVHLQDKPFDLLVLLVSRPGELVARDELQHHLWPSDTFVVFDDNLNAAVRKAREALGDSAESPRFIETVPRHGYRFVAPVDRMTVAASLPAPAPPPPTSRMLQRSSRTMVSSVTAAVASMLVVLLGVGWMVDRSGADRAADPTVRYRIGPAPLTHFPPGGPRLAVSPDGRQVAFVAHLEPAVGRRVWVQSVEAPTPRPVAGTEEAFDVFWGPDSRSLAFVALGMLRRVDLDRDTPTSLGPADGSSGGTWSRESGLLVTSRDETSLIRYPADGGAPVMETALDAAREERAHRFPEFLPDGRSFLYVAQSRRPELSAVYLARVGERGRRLVIETPYKAEFVAPDQLLSVRGDRLVAQRFDVADGSLSGEPRDVTSGVFTSVTDEAWFASSPTGTIAIAGAPPPAARDVAWFGSDGRRLGSLAVPATCVSLALSPDDRRAALECRESEPAPPDIWVADLGSGRVVRATTHPANDESPVWSPDGQAIAYARHRAIRGEADIYVMAAESPFGDRPWVANGSHGEHPTSWSAPAGALLFEQEGNIGKQDIWTLPLGGGGPPRPWLATPASEHRAVLSPDGRWVAFESDRTGRPEVYVRAASGGDAPAHQVSTKGGRSPRWRRGGMELYFVSEDWQIMTATPAPDKGWPGAATHALFDIPGGGPSPAPPPAFDVTADGRRFLIADRPVASGDPPVTVMLNWRGR